MANLIKRQQDFESRGPGLEQKSSYPHIEAAIKRLSSDQVANETHGKPTKPAADNAIQHVQHERGDSATTRLVLQKLLSVGHKGYEGIDSQVEETPRLGNERSTNVAIAQSQIGATSEGHNAEPTEDRTEVDATSYADNTEATQEPQMPSVGVGDGFEYELG